MRKLIPLFLICIFFLCGCSDNTKMLSGWITGYTKTENTGDTVVLIKNHDDKEYGIVINQNSFVYSWIEDAEAEVEQIKNGTAENMEVLAHYEGRLSTVKTDKGSIKAVTAKTLSIYSLLRENAKVLADGTVLDIWESDSSITYKMKDGTELLRVNHSSGPDNVYVGNRESFDDFSEEAKTVVLEYYDNRGLLYDEEQTLETAYQRYTQYGEEFNAYLLEQCVSPAASNDKIMSFLTSVTLPLENGQVGHEIRLGEIFDKQTGRHISGYDIFNCDTETAVDTILDAAFSGDAAEYSDSRLEGNTRLKKEMKAAFKPEYIILWNENLEIAFPVGSLESEDHCYIVGLKYTDEIKSIMHPWAIPTTAW